MGQWAPDVGVHLDAEIAELDEIGQLAALLDLRWFGAYAMPGLAIPQPGSRNCFERTFAEPLTVEFAR